MPYLSRDELAVHLEAGQLRVLRPNKLVTSAKFRLDDCKINGILSTNPCYYIWRPVDWENPKLQTLARFIHLPHGREIGRLNEAVITIIDALRSRFKAARKYPLKLRLQDISEALGAEALGAEALGAEALGAEDLGAEALGAEALGAEALGAELRENTGDRSLDGKPAEAGPSMKEDTSIKEAGRVIPEDVEEPGDNVLEPLHKADTPAVDSPATPVDSPATPVVQEDKAPVVHVTDSGVTYDWDGSEYFGHVYVLGSEAEGFNNYLKANVRGETALKDWEPELSAYAVGLTLLGICLQTTEAIGAHLVSRIICNFLADINNTIRLGELPEGVLKLVGPARPTTTDEYLAELRDDLDKLTFEQAEWHAARHLQDYYTILYAGIRTGHEWQPFPRYTNSASHA
ncbi:hypothetical protein GNI_092870 [Gregarina niphandrodes]|uniref:Uncharacterized protein n=1 Tax=Gregarina niphandrodes TaxID=110365 RepID=A0A023B589_GRENI|nr:hypothetical protein GNI_092870 [Gregarina niphandrodes]EZG59143.1 hypothetical protein GNI_092870 [Gregarina niphandrodes]|eukprot:XP_011130903.1 hypothetical protein GNI_092870 [Gregarina niphandrodes]